MNKTVGMTPLRPKGCVLIRNHSFFSVSFVSALCGLCVRGFCFIAKKHKVMGDGEHKGIQIKTPPETVWEIPVS